MKSTHTLITLVIATVLSVLFGIGYFALVTPNDKQAKAYDEKRASDFAKISAAVQAYRDKNNELPKTLKSLTESGNTTSDLATGNSVVDSLLSSFSALTIRDPQTNAIYGYQYESESADKYKLCTNFATDNNDAADKEVSDKSSRNSQSASVKHGKGNNVCVDFTVTKKEKTDTTIYSSDGNITYNSVSGSINSRDEQRKTALTAIGLDLDKYYQKNGYYPSKLTDLVTEKITSRSIPTDPKTGASYNYIILETKDGKPSRVKVSCALENKSDSEAQDAVGTFSVVAPS